MKRLYVLLAVMLALGGCAGRSDMRSVASQSSAILNAAQIQASSYADAQTRYEAGAQANIASFSKMTTIRNQEMKSAQVTWIDSSMKGIYSDLAPKAQADYSKVIDDATAAPIAPTTVTIDTSKVRSAVAKLNEFAKEHDLESQIAFLVDFGSSVAEAFKEAQKKAADMANGAANQMNAAAPIQK